MKKGWLVVHQRDKQKKDQSVRWRLRNMKSHPLDPGWERGDYRACHEDFREAASEGDIVFDVVYPNGAVRKAPPRIIRSVFTVGSKKGNENILRFRSFYFLDGSWKSGIKIESIWRGHKELSPSETKNYVNLIVKSNFYNRYKAGEKPKSIGHECWEEMVGKARDEIAKRSKSSCGSFE